MSEHLHSLIFGIAVSFIMPAIGFTVGVVYTKVMGGWRYRKIRKWWSIFCLLMPFCSLALVTKAMAEDRFEGLWASWHAEPIQLVSILGLTALLSVVCMIAIVREATR